MKNREQAIETLVWVQGWSREAYEKMTDEELEQMYEREMGKRAN